MNLRASTLGMVCVVALIAGTSLGQGCRDDVVHLTLETPQVPAIVSASAGISQATVSWVTGTASTVTPQSFAVYGASVDWSTWSPSLPGAFVDGGLPCCSFVKTGLQNEVAYWLAVSSTWGDFETQPSARARVKPPGWRGTRQFGTAVGDGAYDVAASGSIAVAGRTFGGFGGVTNAGGLDFFVQLLDASGTPLWSRQLGTAGADAVEGVAITPQGSVIVIGSTTGDLDGNTNQGGSDVFVTKWDADGTKLWTRQFGTASGDFGTSIAVVSDDEVYAVGYTQGALDGSNQGGFDAFLARLDTNGTRAWIRQLGGTGGEIAWRVDANASGIYIAGFAESSLDGNPYEGLTDVFIAKYSSAGARQWVREIGTVAEDEAMALATSPTENALFVAGLSAGDIDGHTNSSPGLPDVFVAKYDLNGGKLWTRLFGTAVSDSATDLDVDASGEVILGGYTEGSLDGITIPISADAFVSKFSASGDQLWVVQPPSSGGEYGEAVAVDGTAAIFVVGGTDASFDSQPPLGEADAFLLKVDGNGTPP